MDWCAVQPSTWDTNARALFAEFARSAHSPIRRAKRSTLSSTPTYPHTMKLSYLIAFAAVVVASTAAPASASTGLTTNNLAKDLQVAPELGALRSLRGASQDVSKGVVNKPKKGDKKKNDKKKVAKKHKTKGDKKVKKTKTN
ncbi:hypothetical protein PF006_g14077 [Phytophthora fragariae]|uniref:Uncharacterized protein n=2 Tax=Phytophthora fragariae TaxID=53985 RepID=A0A6A3EUK7_9STRA|nr:hypothetical protein PF009_g16301 [Phytophthora fragariae]KAE9137885.1 hypothetical protein PF006_g14077 [Phytophthora fragariae]